MAGSVTHPSEAAPDLGHRVAKGALWMVGMRFTIRGIGLASTIIIARLLRPEDFGLVALTSAIVGAVEVLGSWNFDIALIRESNAARAHYDTVWTLMILRAVLIALMLAGLAAPAGAFFGDARMQPVMYAFAIATLIEGLQNVGVVDFRKELNFHQEFIFQVIGKASMFVATVTVALIWRNFWALVAGIVVGRVVGVILSYAMNSFRPRLGLKEWRGLFNFSKWLLANEILTFLGSKFDTFVIGRISGTHAVGLYEIGYEIANLPTGELVFPIQRALLPGYAKLTDKPDELARSYLQGLSIILLIAVPAAVGIAVVARFIVDIFLGPSWGDVVPLLQILSIPATLRLGVANAGSVMLALGRARLITLLDGMGMFILIPCIVIGALADGATGAAWGLALSYVVRLAVTIIVILRCLQLSPAALLAAIWRTLTAAAIMAAAVTFLVGRWGATEWGGSEILELLALSLVGAIIYIATILCLWRLAGRPDGPERDALAFMLPTFRRWRVALTRA